MVQIKQSKVTFFHPDLGIGGAERLVLDAAIALKKQGVDVEFYTNHFDESHSFEEIRTKDIPVYVYGDWLPRSILGGFQALCAYFRMFYLSIIYYMFIFREENRPDIFFIDQIPIAIVMLRLTRRKCIYYCHHPDLLASPAGGILKKLYRKPIDWLEMKGTKLADIILVNSEYTKSVFRSTFPEITQDIKVLFPTIAESFQNDMAHVVPKPLQEIAPVIQAAEATDTVFLSLNRYHPAKNLQLAIYALSKLKDLLSNEEWNKVHLVIAGGYDPQNPMNKTYFRKLVELTHSTGLIVHISFLKSPTELEKAELLKSCDCLIYTPSNEHFGIVPLEAMAAGKPVIAINSGGPRETVEHGVTGFLSEPTAEDLAKHMKKLMDKSLCKKMGVRGLERLKNKFCYDKFCDDIMGICMNALGVSMD